LKKGLVVFLMLLLCLLVFGSSTGTPVVHASSITYNIFATDAFIALADGTLLYNYGFIGGRSSDLVAYQDSWMVDKKAGVPGALVNTSTPGTLCTGTWPAPQPGPIKAGACESQLAGDAQFPAPLIWANVGDTVIINFKNLGVTNVGSPNDPHSIHLHGLDVDAANDGVPETSVGAVPANLAVPGAGNVIVYMFNATKPGTYMYHCHQEADIHVTMGMYGALVVYEGTSTPGTAGTLWGWNYDKDYVLLLSETDTRQHVSEQKGLVGGNAFNPIMYQPQYWFINGLSFPNTVHANGAAAGAQFKWSDWIAAHPGYDPLITGSVSAPSTAGGTGQKVLLRMINMGFQAAPMHMHGFHGTVLGGDQREWQYANTDNVYEDTGLEKNTIFMGSGEVYEWMIDFSKQQLTSTYPPGTQSRYVVKGNLPVSNQQTGNPPIPVPGLVGVNYIGGPTVTGTLLGPNGSQYFPFHNHDDYKATNNGVYPGGMFTMIVPQP
jgi:FtsP/CotA-like multicopper oxidase with cupredoxin domain